MILLRAAGNCSCGAESFDHPPAELALGGKLGAFQCRFYDFQRPFTGLQVGVPHAVIVFFITFTGALWFS